MLTARSALARRLRTAAVAVTVSATALGVFAACQADSGGNGGRPGGATARGTPSAGPSPQAGTAPADPSPEDTVQWDRGPDSIAAVGDSITRGFNTCAVLADCPQASWVTGTDPEVDSLTRRLLDDPAGDSWNLARSGALAAELPGQMRRAARLDPDLVTVLIGANDVCRREASGMTEVADFQDDVRAAIDLLHREAPQAQVFLVSLPDLKRLWSQGRSRPYARQVWRLGICPSMLAQPLSTTAAAEERRRQVQDRVVAYNTALRRICSGDPRCRYDDGAVFDYRFTAEELSPWDWFHPSKQGQRSLAEIVHRQVTADRSTG